MATDSPRKDQDLKESRLSVGNVCHKDRGVEGPRFTISVFHDSRCIKLFEKLIKVITTFQTLLRNLNWPIHGLQ